jgi:hypothetical protein
MSSFTARTTPLHLLFVCTLSVGCWGGIIHADETCATRSIGYGPENATTQVGPILGQWNGQTFLAPDTLLVSVTAYRPSWNVTNVGTHLYITPVDSTGAPMTFDVLAEGPYDVYVTSADSTGLPIPMTWVFDPPLRLPSRGMYAFCLQTTACYSGQGFHLLYDEVGTYPDGIMWYGIRSVSSCGLTPPIGPAPGQDVPFEVTFCHDVVTATKRATWGKLKLIYR